MPDLVQKKESEIADTQSVNVPPPSDEARHIVAQVLQRSMDADQASEVSYEERVLTTPGVLDAFNIAVEELEGIKRTL